MTASADLRPSLVQAESVDWVRDAVFYQIFPDRFSNGDSGNDPPGTARWNARPSRESFFGGDLVGILRKLPYLEGLGVNALYLTPIFKAGTNHRYDTHDYLTVDPALGDAGLLRELVQEAHARGIRVVLDGVFNHVGDGFWAFRDLVERGPDSPYCDWFFIQDFPIQKDPPNYQTCGGAPYLPKLNTADPRVRRHLLDVAVHWIREAGIDGWRLDVPWKVPLEFWREFRREVKTAKPDAYLVGEVWHSWSPWLGVFDGLMNYRLRGRLLDFCLHDAMGAEDLACETEAFLADAPNGGLMLNLLGSHDTPRLLTLAGGDEDRALLALVALFTYPGTPMLYYGDEVGMEGEGDPDCRRPMVWDEQRWRRRIQEAVSRLVDLRRKHAALRRGTWEPVLTFNRVLAFRRVYETDEVLVVLNAGAARRNFTIQLPRDSRSDFQDVLWGRRLAVSASALHIGELPSRAALVLAPRSEANDD